MRRSPPRSQTHFQILTGTSAPPSAPPDPVTKTYHPTGTRGDLATSLFGFPLEAQLVAIGIGERELLHPIGRNARRLNRHAFVVQLLVRAFHVGTGKVQACIAMSGYARPIRRHR